MKSYLLLNEEAKYSITKPYESGQILNYIINIIEKFLESKVENKGDSENSKTIISPKLWTITDATACVGGDTITFSKYFDKVNSVEININNYELLLKNIFNLKCKNITTYNKNYLDIYSDISQDLIYIDPPWQGSSYKMKKEVELFLCERPLENIIPDLIKICKFIFIKVPLNVKYENYKEYINDVKIINNIYDIPTFKIFTIDCIKQISLRS